MRRGVSTVGVVGGRFVRIAVTGQVARTHDRDRGDPRGVLGKAADAPLEEIERPQDQSADADAHEHPDKHWDHVSDGDRAAIRGIRDRRHGRSSGGDGEEECSEGAKVHSNAQCMRTVGAVKFAD